MCAENIGHLVAASSVLTCNDFFCVKFYYRGFVEASQFLRFSNAQSSQFSLFSYFFSDVAGADGGRGLQRAVAAAAAAATVAALKKRRRNISIKI